MSIRDKLFPIQPYSGQWVREKPGRDKGPHPLRIPWSVAELAYSVYSRGGCSQSLETLASRGGFGAAEMDRYVPDWRERCGEIAKLRAALDAARAKLETIVCVHDPDMGVVMLSNDGPCRWDEELKAHVYIHEHFSPLGDALIELHGILSGGGDGPT